VNASILNFVSLAGRQNALLRLAQSRRVFDRLDWWALADWAGSPALHLTDDAALLITPPDLTPSQAIGAGCLPAAWVRWCAVSDGTSASPIVPRLLRTAQDELAQAGIAQVWAIVHAQDWLLGYLHDAGYETVDRMLTYEAAPQGIAAPPASPQLTLRPLAAHELPIAEQLDAQCFEPAWRYPSAIMKPAFEACPVFVLAEWQGAPVGYCCALLNDDHGHVVRLAVDESHRHAGVGAALLAHAVQALARMGAATVSLNTQGGNLASQRLYARMGFKELLERPMVLRASLAHTTGRAAL
jgi:ribosomal protein S18 acetylase RimI-like enzyme